MRFKLAIGMALIACLGAHAYDADASPAADDPYVSASRLTGVPIEVLVAVAGAESDFHPWALNFDGHERYCRSREQAAGLLAGPNDVDIGVMQVNYALWGRRLKLSKVQLLNPRTNILAGAMILRRSLEAPGSLWSRISRYHSGRSDERQRYAERAWRNWLYHRRASSF